MSGSLNKVQLIGHLGKDPETRFSSNGDPICNFSVATSESWKDKSGERQEKTEWHRIVAFGKLAEICGEYLKKGAQVYVEGKLQTRKWTDKNEIERYSTEIVLDSFNGTMTMLGKKGDGGGRASDGGGDETPATKPTGGFKKAAAAPAKAAPSTGNLDTDVPFN